MIEGVDTTQHPNIEQNMPQANINTLLEDIVGRKSSLKLTYSKDGLAAKLKSTIGEEASLTRRLTGITDASDQSETGHLRNDIESWELRKYPWWKEIINELKEGGIEINMLPTSFFQAALDSGLKPEEIIDLDQIISNLKTNPGEFIKRLNLAKKTIVDKSKVIFENNRDFSFTYLADQWRLKPITDSAIESLHESNDTYRKVFPLVKQLNTELKVAITSK